MTQAITVAVQLGPAYSASTISFKIFNVDGTQYADWTSTGFTQIGTTGTFIKYNVSAPDAGGYIEFSTDGGVTVLGVVSTIENIEADVVKIAGAAVNTALAQIGVNVVSQENIDFGALQKASLNAATPASVTGSVGSVADFGTLVADIVTALLTGTYQGRAWRDIWLDVWKQVVGKFVADDADDPTQIVYQSPDESTQLTHDITDTTRDWS